jgi:DNA adenine methylase
MLKTIKELKDTEFISKDYSKWNPKGYVIYIDPPYKNSVTNYYETEEFDHDRFWNIMRKWSKNNIVFISEQDAPKDFISILSIPVYKRIGNSKTCSENLYIYNP